MDGVDGEVNLGICCGDSMNSIAEGAGKGNDTRGQGGDGRVAEAYSEPPKAAGW